MSFDLSPAQRAVAKSYHDGLNLSNRPVDVTPTMRVMPYDGKPAVIGEPDLKAGNGCKDASK